MLGSEARGNKTKEMYYSLLSLLFYSPQASQPNIWELVYFRKISNLVISIFAIFRSQTHEKSQNLQLGALGNFWDNLVSKVLSYPPYLAP